MFGAVPGIFNNWCSISGSHYYSNMLPKIFNLNNNNSLYQVPYMVQVKETGLLQHLGLKKDCFEWMFEGLSLLNI